MRNETGRKMLAERLRIGAEIAAQLTPLKTQKEVAEALGVSPTLVAYEERLALWKVQKRMKELGLSLSA